MTTNFGIDAYSGPDDVDETRVATGPELVALDSIWRLKTPRAQGILAADSPNYGMDLLEEIGAVSTPSEAAALPGRVTAELSKDDRILPDSIKVTIDRTVNGPVVEYAIRIAADTALGPFELVGNIADGTLNLAVKLLAGGVT